MALYDPKEFPGTNANAEVPLGDVLAWARTKPADEAYVFWELDNCALAQFVLQAGFDLHGPERLWLEQPNNAGLLATYEPQTFGAFAARLEKALA